MWKNLLICIIAFVFWALASELAARVVFPQWAPRTGRLTEFWRYDPDYGWAHVPNATGEFASYGFNTTVTINSAGFRGPEVSVGKNSSKYRVLVLGDSFVWGYGVEQAEIFTARMQSLCPGLDVVNFGVSGYSTDQELLLFRNRGLAYQPDMVLLLVAANDYEENAHPREYVYYSKPMFVPHEGRLVLTNHPVPQNGFLLTTAAKAAQRSYVLTQLNRFIEGIEQSYADSVRPGPGDRAPSGESSALAGPFPRTVGETVTALLIQELFRSVKAAHADLVVAFTDGQKRRPHALQAFVAMPDMLFVHLDDIFLADQYERFHLREDFHWNAAGHLLAARAIVRALLGSAKISPEMCPGAASEVSGN